MGKPHPPVKIAVCAIAVRRGRHSGFRQAGRSCCEPCVGQAEILAALGARRCRRLAARGGGGWFLVDAPNISCGAENRSSDQLYGPGRYSALRIVFTFISELKACNALANSLSFCGWVSLAIPPQLV